MGLDMFIFDKEGNEIGYWRKANHIHNWFVKNIQGGNDDCEMYEISKMDLEELKHTCKIVLENKDKARELLPTRSGFFFGSTLYDDWYYEDLIDTIGICNRIIDNEKISKLYYCSSW